MRNSAHNKTVVVVVHDAGGSEVIGAYVRKNPKRERFVCYGNGPSKKVFARLRIPLRSVSDSVREMTRLFQRHADAHHALIASPGWMTNTELNAIQAAKRVGLQTIVYADSWLDDRKRYGHPIKGWKKLLPHQFWAGDRYAFAKLKKDFPGMDVRLEPNQYFADKIKQFRTQKRTVKKPGTMLFTSTTGGDSHRLLEALLQTSAKSKRPLSLRIRFHPADARDRYDGLIRTFANRVSVEKSREKDLVKDLIRARAVVGAETMALAIAVLCGLRAVRFVPQGTRPMLPFKEIVQARNVRAAARLAYHR